MKSGVLRVKSCRVEFISPCADVLVNRSPPQDFADLVVRHLFPLLNSLDVFCWQVMRFRHTVCRRNMLNDEDVFGRYICHAKWAQQ